MRGMAIGGDALKSEISASKPRDRSGRQARPEESPKGRSKADRLCSDGGGAVSQDLAQNEANSGL
jgi:hypothetical protein